ncbi:retinol dehydrogenase 12 [Tribolium castaneum]|uniref:WW domain-containing oxidoreductase-like Protein n=1 Tax=Tribolium castaneum TaxID=7070 RepID=D2A0S5_TRICA|nr:PREDICTED: retinol dehydrogenase 12 [Tribolium castaneum]EFA02555.1 WW domain-containing oxidoreductase-like Protein [Tribolium castaneum]|eukprot:XP_970723.1 PREDICTED: retinol dehydrogenase 12 [Tribolium castaneum]
MFLLIGCGIIIIVTIVAIWRSKKPLKTILAEAKYELLYNAVGSRAILEDVFMRSKNKTDLPILSGKVAVITGGARGIGAEVVKMLLRCDIHVIIGCRNTQAGEQVLQKCRDSGVTTGDVTVYKLDISVLDSVKSFAKVVAEKHPKINYLINNAGIMFGPYIESRDGYESQFSTNYLGHFLLTHLLLPQLCAAGTQNLKSRIVNVSSCAHLVGEIKFEDINNRHQYISGEAYAQSKLAQVLFTNYLESVCKKENMPVQLHSVHPGIVNTELFDGTHLKNLAPWVPSLMFKTPEQGAIPIVHACLSPHLEGKGGTYIHNCRIFSTSENAKSEDLQEKLFNFTKDLLKIEDFGQPHNNNN